jgi:putative ABC transport system ATP-binding protein
MLLSLQQVSKRFQSRSGERVALDGVTLEVERGQMVGIYGPSGSGKTTLLRIAAGLESPDAGSVEYKGERLDQMSAAERQRHRRQEISCIWAGAPWQERLSVLDQVALALLVDRRGHSNAERRAREALLACEVEHCVDMEIGEISDGERQRVAIARAIVTEPRLLLADRPALGLSFVEQEAVMTLLGMLAHEAKVAVLITDSNAEALIAAEPVLYLCDGKLLGQQDAERGKLYRFPATGSRRAALDA